MVTPGGSCPAAAAALLGFGVALSWMFGREFAEKTVEGLFALPVSRSAIALAKLLVFVSWSAVVATALVVLLGVATTIGVIVTAQVMVVAGTGAWFPPAAPALWALSPSAVTPVQLGLVIVLPVIFVPATLVGWHRLRLDR